MKSYINFIKKGDIFISKEKETIIKVCDSIMGSGKSSAAINYINSAKNKKFIYITPFLDEVKRIKIACAEKDFIEPQIDKPNGFTTKISHMHYLIDEGKNIVTTHELFKRFDTELRDKISKGNYNLIIDEVIETYERLPIKRDDIELMKEANYIQFDDSGKILFTKENYNGNLSCFKAYSKSSEIVNIDESIGYYRWIFSKGLLECFNEVILMTYLFEYSIMNCYFKQENIEYEKIYVKKNESETYEFTDSMCYLPSYAKNLSKLINIFDNQKLNRIGNNKNAFSSNWINRLTEHGERTVKIRNNLYNYFRHYFKNEPASKKMWSTFGKGKNLFSGNGYASGFLSFNYKATNDYADRSIIAYLVNIFNNPVEKNYYSKCNPNYNEDGYAVSVMVQWIWRSAIRNGQPITIYIPSRRMRTLLKKWIKAVEADYKALYK